MRWMLARRAAALAILLSASPTVRLSAQVGHDPQRSPFRDITTPQGLSLLFGRFAGARAVAPVGARPGLFTGLRLETRLSGPLDMYLTLGRAASSRMVVNPSDTVNRITGPIDQTLVSGDLALILNVTGPKRWHGLAPYLGLGLGVLQPSRSVTDPGGFRVGSNFVIAPTIGTKVFLRRSLALRLEARDYWLRYEWPTQYFAPTDSTNAALPPVVPTTTSIRQVTHNFTLTAGLIYLFTF